MYVSVSNVQSYQPWSPAQSGPLPPSHTGHLATAGRQSSFCTSEIYTNSNLNSITHQASSTHIQDWARTVTTPNPPKYYSHRLTTPNPILNTTPTDSLICFFLVLLCKVAITANAEDHDTDCKGTEHHHHYHRNQCASDLHYRWLSGSSWFHDDIAVQNADVPKLCTFSQMWLDGALEFLT